LKISGDAPPVLIIIIMQKGINYKKTKWELKIKKY